MTYPFLQAGDFHAGRLNPLRVVVLHTPENDEYGLAAENLAQWMSGHVEVSYHQVSDDDSTVSCVRSTDTGFHAYGFNSPSYGASICGRAGQGPDGWRDDFSTKARRNCARSVVDLVPEVKAGIIPVRLIEPDEILAGAAGFTDHHRVAVAYGYGGERSDVGFGFPWDLYLSDVRSALGGVPITPPAPPPPDEEDPVLVVLYPPAEKAHHRFNETGYRLGYRDDEQGDPKRDPRSFRHVYVNATPLAGEGNGTGRVRLRVKAQDGAEKCSEVVTVPVLGRKTWDLAELVVDGVRHFPDPGAMCEVESLDGSPVLCVVTASTVP